MCKVTTLVCNRAVLQHVTTLYTVNLIWSVYHVVTCIHAVPTWPSTLLIALLSAKLQEGCGPLPFLLPELVKVALGGG